MAERILNSVISNIIQVSPTMRIIRIKPDFGNLPDFTAGQFISIGLPATAPRCADSTPEAEEHKPGKMIKRLYSIASSSVSKEYIELYITLVRSGALTPRIFNLQIGDRIELGKRTSGIFTLEEVPEGNNVILIATGTGVAPYISMIRSNALQKRLGRIAVIQGAANSWDLGYSSELILIESMSDKFSYHPTILIPEKEPGGWQGDTRLIQDIWKDSIMTKLWGTHPKPSDTHIFLCGNPNMTESMLEMLKTEGFEEHSRKSPGQVHIESW
jgi:ferredoxin--NADP+ reductase